MRFSHLRWVGVIAISTLVARAELKLASLFQDHAVLQQGQVVPVWGTANPGQVVAVAFRDHVVRTTSDAAGRWRTALPALSASAVGGDLVVSADQTVTLHDIVVGEVWLCSGQSNMEWNVARAANAPVEMAAARFPAIRAIKIGVASVIPRASAIAGGSWTVCQPETVGGFTAVGYHFARELHEALGVPVGIVDATWGGTVIEAWLSEETLLSNPEFKSVFEKWARQIETMPARRAAWETKMTEWRAAAAAEAENGKQAARSRPVDFWGLEERARPMGLFGGMIAPFVPYALRGVAWYQGENNAGQADYQSLLTALMADWRRQWGQGEFPFFVVQLPNYAAGSATGLAWARTREAQAKAVQSSPNAALAVTIDLGEPANVHPLHKREVGRRLALLALATIHGRDVEAQGPTFAGVKFEGAAATVSFTHAKGLHCTSDRVVGFEVAGEDRNFVRADAKIAGASVRLTAAAVPRPVAVRYAWHNAPDTNLFNAAGLPAAPFRSDDW